MEKTGQSKTDHTNGRILRLARSVPLMPIAIILIGGSFVFAQESAAGGREFEWETAPPESQGMSASRLHSLRETLVQRRTSALLVIRNDKIVYEWCAPDLGPHQPIGTASLAKALVGGMSVAVALTDGKISLDDPVAQYVPAWKSDTLKSKILVRHLGSHTSGLADASQQGVKHEDLTGWMGDFWKKLGPPNDPFSIARDQTPVLFTPGERIKYSNPGIAMLTYCVASAFRDSANDSVRTLLRDRVMRPIGVSDEEWSVGYQTDFHVDGLNLIAAWGGATFSTRATARVGRLLLRNGDWQGQQILSAESVRQVTTDAGMPGHCGMGWWTNGGRYPGLPQDAFWGAGAGDRVLLVVPSLQLIAVRSGQTLLSLEELEQLKPKDVFEEFHDPREKLLFRPLIETLVK